jgi:hypothetical protein
LEQKELARFDTGSSSVRFPHRALVKGFTDPELRRVEQVDFSRILLFYDTVRTGCGEARIMRPFVFPKWVNTFRVLLAAVLLGGPLYAVVLAYYGGSPRTLNVGYMPKQPVPYDHSVHVGQLGLDCRYCHNTVEDGATAAIPPTDVCMNCHARIGVDRPNIIPVKESHATGMPIEWLRVHDLPDYVYFNHSAHVTRGIGCVSCHGRVDKMEEVFQAETLTMSWCLDCHRNPEPHLRPMEFVTKMDWVPPEEPIELGRRLRKKLNINPSTDCSTCHR